MRVIQTLQFTPVFGSIYDMYVPRSRYPIAELQCWGNNYKGSGACEAMPLEMTADNLQMTAAAAFVTGDFSIVQSSWGLFTQYADYLVGHGLDPTAQLCSDDFEGPSPHNANLAAKSIIGIAVYASLCDATNRTCGKKYMAVATDCAYCTSAVPATHHITSLVLGMLFDRLLLCVRCRTVGGEVRRWILERIATRLRHRW